MHDDNETEYKTGFASLEESKTTEISLSMNLNKEYANKEIKDDVSKKFQYSCEYNNTNFKTEKNKIMAEMKILENEYLKKFEPEFIKNKNFKIKEFIRLIQSKSFITEEDFTTLKLFSLQKGGFLTNENRQHIYRKIFFHEFRNNNKIKLLKIDDSIPEIYTLEEEIDIDIDVSSNIHHNFQLIFLNKKIRFYILYSRLY